MKKLITLVFAISVFSYSSIAQDAGMNITGSAKLTLEIGTYLLMDGDLKISVTDGLIIPRSTFVTTDGALALDAPLAITVESDASGRGSYIVNGSVSSSNKGSMKVESYISGSAGTNYFMHFVGAPVEDTTVGWSGKVRLQQFDMTYLDTYAFDWDATIDTNTGQPWINIWPYWHEVPVGNGLTLSNYVAGTGTIEMVGYPVSGNVSYTIRNVTDNGLELISNPFPSAIDFDDFADDNSTYIEDKYWIYSPSTGNWIARSDGTGGNQYLQHGQGFFVETKANGNISFTDSYKTHSTDAFREIKPNLLSLKVEGGTIGFEDELYILFSEQGTTGYDEEIEAKKWNSVSEGATMIRSIAEDETELAINVLPIERLYSEITTVPVHFECGESAEYTFTFEGIESYDNETEVWLEDLLNDSYWYSISEANTTYTFTASPDDAKHRFNIHFFGPTSVQDPITGDENGLIKIYSSKEYAYIVNKSDELIKEIAIYNMMGEQILRKKVPAQQTSKFYVSDRIGYYVVRVLTDKQLHTGKVLILR